MTFWRRFFDWCIGNSPWALAMLIFAGITHIVSVLAMPRLAPRDAYARMERLAPLFRTTLLPPTAPGAANAPFDDPALAQAVCRYDLSRGVLRFKADLPPDALTLMSFHARFGQLYYSMTDRSATRGKLDVIVLTQRQLEAVEADDEDELPQELRIVSPTQQGFVLIRALAALPGDMPEAQRRALSLSCAAEPNSNS